MKAESLKPLGNIILIGGFSFGVFQLLYWNDPIGFFITVASSGITSGYVLGKYKQATGKTTWLDSKKLRKFFPGVNQDWNLD